MENFDTDYNIENLRKIENELIDIKNKIDDELVELNDKEFSKSFKTNLIELVHKYPDNKDLIEFFISLNDNLSTKNEIFRDIVLNALNGLIDVKKQAVLKCLRILEAEKTQPLDYVMPLPPVENENKFINFFKDPKTILIFIAVLIFIILLVVDNELAFRFLDKLVPFNS